jgi:hypothetical protein
MWNKLKVSLGIFLAAWTFIQAQEQGEWLESGIWYLEQDFVKFGKKEVYEYSKKSWLQQFKKFNGENAPVILGLQESDSLQYYYFMPQKNYAGLDSFFQLFEKYNSSSLGTYAKNQEQMLKSAVNYQINSLHRYLSFCSYSSEEAPQEAMNAGHYFVYSLVPGNEKFFEDKLQKIGAEARGQNSRNYWKVWKVVFGGDVPKYIVCVFAKSTEELSGRIKVFEFSDGATKEIITRIQEGKLTLRKDLSLLP